MLSPYDDDESVRKSLSERGFLPMEATMLVLSRSDVKRLVPMAKAIDLMALAFSDLAAGKAHSPLRTPLEVERGPGVSLFMPAYVPSAAALGLKVVSVFGGNEAKGVPTITSIVCLLDDETGQPVAMMDGGYLTALRTGAISGLATRLLARDDSRVLTVIGAGAQGVTQAAAVCEVREIEQVVFVTRSEERAAQLLTSLDTDWPGLVDRVATTQDVSDAVKRADIICTATTSATPVFDDADVRPGTHINGVGSFKPEMQEIPSATIVRATITVDEIEPALEEAGDLIIPLNDGAIDKAHVTREIGHLVNGDIPGRASNDEVTFFKSVGNAVQDMVAGRFAYDEALRQGVGQEVTLT
jgi:ornithine cyclodeaminase